MEIVVENPEVPVGNLLENSSEILNFKLNNNAESETQETVEYAKKEEVILTPNGNGISNAESPFGRSISTNVDHHGSNEDLLEGFKTKRYGGRFDFSMITFQKIQEGAYGAIPWMIGCAVLGLVSLIILSSTHHTLFQTNCLPNWDSKDGNCYLAVEDQKTFSEAWQYCDRVSGSKGKLFEPHSSTNDIVKNMYQGRLVKSWIGIIEYDSRNFVFHSDLSSLTWENWSYQRNESCLSITKMCTTTYLYTPPTKCFKICFAKTIFGI